MDTDYESTALFCLVYDWNKQTHSKAKMAIENTKPAGTDLHTATEIEEECAALDELSDLGYRNSTRAVAKLD